VSKRYARALLMLGDEHGRHEIFARDLDAFCQVLASEPSLARFFDNPAVLREDKLSTLNQIIAAASPDGLVSNFLKLALEKGRLTIVPDIRDEYVRQLDARSGRARADVSSATPLGAGAIERIRAHLVALLHKDVFVESSVDESLIGGLVVRVGNTVYDASVSNRIRRLRERLVAVH